jgi:flagellar motor protein MotB
VAFLRTGKRQSWPLPPANGVARDEKPPKAGASRGGRVYADSVQKAKTEIPGDPEKSGQVVAGYPNGPLVIEGHTDGKCTHPYNIKLSENRAGAGEAMAGYECRCPSVPRPDRGLGETKPVAPNTNRDRSDNPEVRQKNRRVELTLLTE